MHINLDGKRQLDRLYNDNTAGWYCLPTRDDIENLQIGDDVPDCFGRLANIVEIYAKGYDIHCMAYACCYVSWSGGKISASFKENEVSMTVPLCEKYHRSENVPV